MPKEDDFSSRDHIEIRIPANGKSCICWCRIIDDNFLRNYNTPPRITIHNAERSLVVNDYYRGILGVKSNNEYEIEITRVKRFQFIKKVQALLWHPDNSIKLATWLALWSVLLGVVGIFLGILSLCKA
jgi:hypothetical protein